MENVEFITFHIVDAEIRQFLKQDVLVGTDLSPFGGRQDLLFPRGVGCEVSRPERWSSVGRYIWAPFAWVNLIVFGELELMPEPKLCHL